MNEGAGGTGRSCAYFLFLISHVHSDTLGRHSSESDVRLTALFINSFQGFPWSLLLLQCLE